jgi:4'-phosphopantetheinyl transferase EntD
MLSDLFSHRVLVEHMSNEELTGMLYPEERESLKALTGKRLREFTLGRLCAHKALAHLGIYDFPILVGKTREPLWPQGVFGSISHCGGDCIVAVSNDDCIAGVGVDIEKAVPLDEDVADMVCTTNDKDRLTMQTPSAPAYAETLIFSAKESVYKCLFPVTKTFFEFRDVEITLARREHEFSVEILRPDIRRLIEPLRLRGRFYCADGRIYTGLELEKPAFP